MAAGLLNPVQGFNRLVTGEAWSDLPNPEGRFPGRFALSVELGGDLNREDTPFSSQAVTAVALRYGDPNEEPLQKPFDFFDLSLEAAAPAHELMSHVWVRGLLAGRGLDGRGPLSRHVLGLGMRYEYLTAGPEIFAGEAFEGGVLSLLPLGGGLQARTEAQAAFFPLAAVKTDYDALSQAAVGRNYDFSTGGGPRLDARLRRDDLDLLRVACSAIWFATWNGIASSARVQWALLEARWPVAGPLSLGAGWSWYDRVSTYPRAAAAVRAYSQGRLFASFLYR